MPAKTKYEAGGLIVIHVSGQLTDEDRLQTLFAASSEAQFQGKIRGLMVLEDFEGWAEGHWDDPAVHQIGTEIRQSIERIAVVGPVTWKDRWLTFLDRADSPTEVRYFTEGEDGMARAWLAGSSV